MSILDRDALAASPLADLHALASELSIDGYRRLRKAELVDAILTRQGGESTVAEEEEEAGAPVEEERPSARRRRGRRGGRGRGGAREDEEETAPAGEAETVPADEEETAPAGEAETVPADEEGEAAAGPAPEGLEEIEEQVERAVRGKRRREPEVRAEREPEVRAERDRGQAEEEIVEGEVELLPNGSGFLRVNPPEPSEDDVYVSAAQVKRCELVPGDKISGPRRSPRRSERFASLIRIDTINDRPAEEVVDSTRFDDLPAAFPSERFKFGSDDPTIKAIEWLTPFGLGSRVIIAGPAGAGKTEALRRLAATLTGTQDIHLSLVLAGVRPEEISEWQEGPVAPDAAVSFAASADAQAQTLERAIDQARRLAARGSHVVVLIDTLSGVQPHAARKLLASAKNIAAGGSVTVIATASEPLGGETTVIALDPLLASTGRYPALDLLGSWTIRPEMLVGEAGAEAIARARMEAIGG
ncbi:MAG: Rho termination factor N-terminal domain-containing protein [Solirubrobacterales bacterium]|nr:Rho termination factor N-terminal domain-containing protein [Solirubrobacterales bacterium]